MDRELVDLFEAAKKAADLAANDGVSASGPEVSRCIDALKELKAVPVSYDILVATQVGKKLRPLTKHPMDRIKTVASDLLEIWKKIVIEETTKSKKDGKTNAVKLGKVQSPRLDRVKVEKVMKVERGKSETVDGDSPRTINVEKIASNVKVEKMDHRETKVEQNYKQENIDSGVKKSLVVANGPPKLKSMVKCNDAIRDKVRELLAEALSKVADEAAEDLKDQVVACDPIRVAVAVESAMFEKLGRSNGTQKFKYRSIMFNIKDQNNPDLRRRVLLGEVQPERLIGMTPEEMASQERKRENEKIKEKALLECQRGGAVQATTNQFKCGRCKKNECTYYQMQTRSADEPMTTYVTCVNCSNRWKFC